MFHVNEGESVAVNYICISFFMIARGGILRDFLGLIRSTNPTNILMAEHNEPSLETRLGNPLRYYAAVFDSIGFSLPLDNPARIKNIEETYLCGFNSSDGLLQPTSTNDSAVAVASVRA